MTNSRKRCDNLTTSREPLHQYGALEDTIRAIRDHRPLDLNAERWREEHPAGEFAEWRQQARACLLEGLHYDPRPLDLQAEILGREERDGFVLEHVAFNTTPWIRVNGYFLLPQGAAGPVPGIVMCHAWGGPLVFGKDRIVNSGRDHPALQEHRDIYYGGKYVAEEFARSGYAVLAIDAHHFGERIPYGLTSIPQGFDPYELTAEQMAGLNVRLQEHLYLGVRQLNWAGTTWAGLNYWDDSRCVDYLLSRPEVDGDNIGCTGFSGGAWRTNMLAALDGRIKAAVSACWMTTGDYQQIYNVAGCVGCFALLPGVWSRLDVPDLTIMSAPCASMVISTTLDPLFPLEGQDEAARQIRDGYEWTGCPEKFVNLNPAKPHCFDADLQGDALHWFDRHLKT